MNPDLADPVARLFVTAGRPGMVVFRDLVPPGGNDKQQQQEEQAIDVRARVSIHRHTGAQRGQRLFDHETWYAKELTGSIEAWFDHEETANLDLALLLGGLRLVDAIGANRSAGLGRCKVEVTQVVRDGAVIDWRQLLDQELGRATA